MKANSARLHNSFKHGSALVKENWTQFTSRMLIFVLILLLFSSFSSPSSPPLLFPRFVETLFHLARHLCEFFFCFSSLQNQINVILLDLVEATKPLLPSSFVKYRKWFCLYSSSFTVLACYILILILILVRVLILILIFILILILIFCFIQLNSIQSKDL